MRHFRILLLEAFPGPDFFGSHLEKPGKGSSPREFQAIDAINTVPIQDSGVKGFFDSMLKLINLLAEEPPADFSNDLL